MNMLLTEIRYYLGYSVEEVSLKTGLSENLIVSLEEKDGLTPNTLIHFYADNIGIRRKDLSFLFARPTSAFQKKLIRLFQSIIAQYLKFSRKLKAFDETHK